MPDKNKILFLAKQWMQKAENDLKTAEHTLTLGKDCPTDTVCFHAQQCTEKYLKALLVYRKIDFPKTHSISELMALLPVETRPELRPVEQERLTDYATATRYPGIDEPISLNEAENATGTARSVRAFIKKLIPVEENSAS